MHKALVQLNIQLNRVISNITGVTGLNIIQAILKGERDPKKLANLSVRGCRKNIVSIEKSLEGNFRKEHIFAFKQAYEEFEFFHKQIHECEKSIESFLPSLKVKAKPDSQEKDASVKKGLRKTKSNRSRYYFNASIELKKITGSDLTTIPGIDSNIAMKILSEIGTDMTQWPNVKAFSSWLGLSPGNKISGGKVLSSRTKSTNNHAAQALRMAAASLFRSKTAIGAFFRRMRSRLGAPKAITAAAHKIARILYRMLTTGENYREVGENYYEQQYQKRVIANLAKRAKDCGYKLIKVS